jgi:hypothetical protein
MLALVAQERERLLAVGHGHQLDADLGLAQRLAREAHVAGVVLHQQDRAGAHCASLAAGRVKQKRLPPPARDSAQIVPPCRSTTFLAIDSPIPVPGQSSRAGATGLRRVMAEEMDGVIG